MSPRSLRTRVEVLARACVRRAATAARRRRPDSPRRILIAQHMRLGDTLLLTPLVAKLRQAHPDAEIVLAMPGAFEALYSGQPYGVTALGWDARDPESLRRLFSGPGFDLAYVPGENRCSWLALAADARWIVAFAGDRPAYTNWPVDEPRECPSAPCAWADMAAGLADGEPPRPYRAGDWPAPACAPFELPASRYCVLHAGASTALKQWEPAKWRSLAGALAERGYVVAWSAGPGEEDIVAACGPERGQVSYAGRLDLAQMWRLLARASLLVTLDTGIAHMGRLTGVPTVTLFGPSSARLFGAAQFWRDIPYRAVTIEPFPCRDQDVLLERRLPWVAHCYRTGQECASPRCMRGIDTGRVLDAVDALLGRRRRAQPVTFSSSSRHLANAMGIE